MPNMTLSRPIDRAGLVTLSCSTHTWMRGYLHVTEELAAVTRRRRPFRLDGVPAGHARAAGLARGAEGAAPVKVVVKDGETATVDLTLAK